MKHLVINSQHVTSEVFDKEAVIVNFMTGKYFGLSGSGPDIWHIFQSPCTIEKLNTLFSESYSEITGEQLAALGEFVNRLEQEELLVQTDVPADAAPGLPENRSEHYITPVLEIYDDLQELIVLDPVHDVDSERGWPARQNMQEP